MPFDSYIPFRVTFLCDAFVAFRVWCERKVNVTSFYTFMYYANRGAGWVLLWLRRVSQSKHIMLVIRTSTLHLITDAARVKNTKQNKLSCVRVNNQTRETETRATDQHRLLCCAPWCGWLHWRNALQLCTKEEGVADSARCVRLCIYSNGLRSWVVVRSVHFAVTVSVAFVAKSSALSARNITARRVRCVCVFCCSVARNATPGNT